MLITPASKRRENDRGSKIGSSGNSLMIDAGNIQFHWKGRFVFEWIVLLVFSETARFGGFIKRPIDGSGAFEIIFFLALVTTIAKKMDAPSICRGN